MPVSEYARAAFLRLCETMSYVTLPKPTYGVKLLGSVLVSSRSVGCVPQVVEMQSGDPVGFPGYAACHVGSAIV